MELHDLRVLESVVDYGGITRAAARLHTAQSAVSQTIHRLERELHLELFVRLPGSGGVRLTEAGQALAAHARAIQKAVERAEDEMSEFRGLGKGTVTAGLLSTTSAVLLAPLLKQLKLQHPGIRLRARELMGQLIPEKLRLGELDLAIVFLPFTVEDLVISTLGEFELYLVVAADHPLARQEFVCLQEVAEEPWVSFTEAPGHEWLAEAFAGTGRKPNIIMEVTSATQLKGYVEAGLGLSLLPLPTVANELAAHRLAAIPLVPRSTATVALASTPKSLGVAAASVRAVVEEVIADLSRGTPTNAPGAAMQAHRSVRLHGVQ